MSKSAKIPKQTVLSSSAQMLQFGAKLAPIFRPGDVVFLIGDLGAGKTTLAKGMIYALIGEKADVSSPTYNLVHVLEGPDFEIWHADLYRLSAPAEVLALGLEDAFEHALTLVEWPDRMGEMAPDQRLDICIEKTGEGRKITLRPQGKNWKDRLYE